MFPGLYYKAASAIMIIYDVNSRKSFANIGLWLEDIDKYLHQECILMLVGNKCDSSQREVSFE